MLDMILTPGYLQGLNFQALRSHQVHVHSGLIGATYAAGDETRKARKALDAINAEIVGRP